MSDIMSVKNVVDIHRELGYFRARTWSMTHRAECKLKIPDWPKVERPREKPIQYGPERLSNTELLAIILRSRKKRQNVVDLANKMIKKFKAEKLPDLSYGKWLSKF